jgi:hypothetical protein
VVLENKDLASQPIALSVATYASAPNVGGGAGAFKTGDSFFFDVQVVDPSTVGTEDRLTCTFYYPASVSGDLEAGLELMYFNGTAWVPALDAAGQVATKNTTDNLDGTLSGGRFSIVLDDQSSPKLHDLVGTVFVLARRDHTPPKIVSLSVTPSVIDSKNHKMVGAVVTANVTDDIDPNPSVRIVSITSNEPVNGTGDGDTAPDWEITGAMTANVRAERSGNGKGRIYTITVEARDASGNTATGTVTVSVPKNGKG